MPDHRSYVVPKVQEQRMKVAAAKGGANDVFIEASPPVGAQKNPSSSPDPMFAREFSAEKDLQTLIAANKIRRDKARYGRAIELKERLAQNMCIKNSGGGVIGERKGPNNAGVRGRPHNTFDRRSPPSNPLNGTKMDGQKGRW